MEKQKVMYPIVIASLLDYFAREEAIAFRILLVVMVLDVISGLLKAAKNKQLRSFIMSWGIFKKSGMLLAIILSLLLDLLLNSGTPAFGIMMTWLAIGNEALSIIENLHELGVPIPEPIINKVLDMSDVRGEFNDNPFLRKEFDSSLSNEKTDEDITNDK